MAPSTWPDKHSTQPSSLRQNTPHDTAVDIGQPEVAAGIPIGEPLVIEAHEVQNRLVKVVNMNRVFFSRADLDVPTPKLLKGPRF